jgi:hypothetical protein
MLCVTSIAYAAEDITARDHDALQRALIMAGPQPYIRLPILLTSELPWTASPDAEAWTVFFEDGKGDRIFVYTGSRVFRCASVGHRADFQCVLKLASIIVHEAWHHEHGPEEAPAYEAQLAFLEFKQASGALITEVRQARRRALSRR